jgi:hypothetical protein
LAPYVFGKNYIYFLGRYFLYFWSVFGDFFGHFLSKTSGHTAKKSAINIRQQISKISNFNNWSEEAKQFIGNAFSI